MSRRRSADTELTTEIVSGRVISEDCLPSDSYVDDDSFAKELYYLNIALRCACIPTRDSSKYFIWANNFICLNLLTIAIGVSLYVPITTLVTQEHELSFQSALIPFWYVYSSLSYTYLSYLVRSNPSMIDILKEVRKREKNNRFSDPCNEVHLMRTPLFACLLAILSNIALNVRDPSVIMSSIGLTDHPMFYCYCVLCISFLSCGWLMPAPIVIFGCRVLTTKIKHLLNYINDRKTQSNSDEKELIDMIFAMTWHDDLYEKNRQLNNVISALMTLAMSFMTFSLLCIALHFAVIGFDANQMFWLSVNFIALSSICFPVGELEIQNKLLGIAVGTLSICPEFGLSTIHMHQYLSLAVKCEKAEFGIFVKGTKILISFNSIIRIGSLTLSGIIFLGGLVRSI